MRAGSGAGEPCRGRRVILIRRELTAMQSLRGRNLLCYSWAPCLRLRPTGLLFLLVHWHASWMAGVGIATSEHLAASSSTNGYVLGGLAASMPRLSLRGGGRPREAPGGRTRGSASTKRASSKRNTQDGGLVKDAEEAFAAGRYEVRCDVPSCLACRVGRGLLERANPPHPGRGISCWMESPVLCVVMEHYLPLRRPLTGSDAKRDLLTRKRRMRRRSTQRPSGSVAAAAPPRTRRREQPWSATGLHAT